MRIMACLLMLACAPLSAQQSNTYWGPSINDLQVGIAAVGDPSYAVGHTAQFELSIRNVGAEPIEFRYVESTVSQWIPRFVVDEDLPCPVVWVPRDRGGIVHSRSLSPGAEMIMGRGTLEFRALDSLHPLAGPAAFASPGTHRVTAMLHIEHPIWKGESRLTPKLALTTGAVKISVAESEWTESREREEALRVLADTRLTQLRYQRMQGMWSSAGFTFYTHQDWLRVSRLDPATRSHLERISESHEDPFYRYLAGALLR